MPHAILTVAVIAFVTILLRFIPFIVFKGKETPAIIVYLGKVLPFAVMGMLVVYCLKSVSVLAYPFGLPELIAGISVVLLHLWRKNTLLSIAGGTGIYMVLVQFIFI